MAAVVRRRKTCLHSPKQEQSQGQDETDAPDMDSAEEIARMAAIPRRRTLRFIYIPMKSCREFITKKDAEALGWDSKKAISWEVADGMSIGGDRFGTMKGCCLEEDGLA